MPVLRKIVATPNTDRPMYQKNIGVRADRARRSPARRLRRSARVARARGRPRRTRASSEHARACSGLRCGCFTFQRPATCSITSFESPRTRATRAGVAARRLEPGDERAVLGDVVGGLADALADRGEPLRRRARRVEHDRTDRGGPGIAARATVEVDRAPRRASGDQDRAAVVAVGERIAGRLLDLLRFDGRDRQVTSLAGGADEPRHARRPAPGRGTARSRSPGARRCPRRSPSRAARSSRASAVITASASASVRRMRSSSPSSTARCSSSSASVASSGSRVSMSSSSRFSTLRWCLRSCSTSACIACSSRGELISPEYILASTSLAFSRERARFVVELLLVAGHTVAFGARGGEAGVDRGGVGLGPREGITLGKRLVTVPEPVECAVVLLEREERFERLDHLPGPGSGGRGRRAARRVGRRARPVRESSAAAGRSGAAGGTEHRCIRGRDHRPGSRRNPRRAHTGPASGRGMSGRPASAWLMNERNTGAAEVATEPGPGLLGPPVAEPDRGGELRGRADEPGVGPVVGRAGLAEDRVTVDGRVAARPAGDDAAEDVLLARGDVGRQGLGAGRVLVEDDLAVGPDDLLDRRRACGRCRCWRWWPSPTPWSRCSAPGCRG